uniref:Globin domain-containing protein n=1 Tax=Strix occidentalis caurina TaxID=311401 RepID=A0A8D0EY70_STROC
MDSRKGLINKTNIHKLGCVSFLDRMFTDHPDTKTYFTHFKGMDSTKEMKQSDQVGGHSKMVFTAINNMVQHLDNSKTHATQLKTDPKNFRVSHFLSATGFPCLSFNNKTQKSSSTLDFMSSSSLMFFSSNRNRAFLGQLSQLLLSNNGNSIAITKQTQIINTGSNDSA